MRVGDQDKRKLCWNCEGSVLRHLESCPYCGVYLSPSDQSDDSQNLLSPPFPSSKFGHSVPKPPYQSQENPTSETEIATTPATHSLLSPLLMFITGTSFGLFGLTLWLFSEKGRLTLSWNEDWAMVFLIISAILLIFGGRSLSRLQDS